MARPKSDNKRDKMLAVMLTAVEWESMQLEACQFGQSLSSYARSIILDRPALTIVPEPNRKLWLELSKVAGNLNQLQHAVNAGCLHDSAEITPVVKELRIQVTALREQLLGGK